MVLLKNDGTLPLKPGVKRIAVVGPLADQTRVLLGNYNGIPTHTVSFMEGLKAEFPNAKITYVPGTQFLRNDGQPVPDAVLTTPDGKPGLEAEYSNAEGMSLMSGEKPKPSSRRVEPNVNLSQSNLPSEVVERKPVAVQWTGFLTPTESGDYLIGIRAAGFGSVSIDGKDVAREFGSHGVDSHMGRVHLEKGQKAQIARHVRQTGRRRAHRAAHLGEGQQRAFTGSAGRCEKC